ncbi:hypothetical protein [Georgenia sp. H159]|uniref:hypothetical protein n=1 Tax=Georgenia sp. H159 TaxID=3076115 RepID=UPI002D765DE1|nr:hypothetical protein [Georgenia sp. H159]
MQLSGTTTFASDALAALAARHDLTAGGFLETAAVLQREPDNAVDPRAVAVLIEGERIGYLPGHLARRLPLEEQEAREVPVQLFTEVLPAGLRTEAWAWLGQGRPRWEWSASNRPPMSPAEKRYAAHQASRNMVAEALVEGGARAASFQAGMVDGVHYLELVEPIKQLKRQGRNEEALTLCYKAIEGAENSRDGREPAPWYTEQAAIIHRKLGQRDQEITVLERWLAACPPDRREGSKIAERLAKVRAS